MSKMIQIHFIDIDSDKLISKEFSNFVPSVNDEIRIAKSCFYHVEKRVWIYDEPECPFYRINIGVHKINVEE